PGDWRRHRHDRIDRRRVHRRRDPRRGDPDAETRLASAGMHDSKRDDGACHRPFFIAAGGHQSQRGGKPMRHRNLSIIAAGMTIFALAIAVAYAQDKYLLVSPGGIAFSDFKGYEDWAMVSSARTDEVLKVIVANPAMIAAYKAGVPANGQAFPDGSKIVKLQWKPKKSTEAPFVVDVPDVFSQAFVIEKDSRRFPGTGGWGYAVFNYDSATNT